MGRALQVFAFLLVAALHAPSAHAQVDAARDPGHAANARLGLLSAHERELLEPHLARGPVALIEFSAETELPAIIIATHIDATPACVRNVLRDPAGYPEFMPALDRVEVRARHEHTTEYAWTWRTAIFTLRGTSTVTAFPRPRGRRGALQVGVRHTSGDFGLGRGVFRIYPHGDRGSLLVFSSRIDMREANFLTRQLSRGQRGINRSINIALGLVMVLGTKHEAEEREGHLRAARPTTREAELVPRAIDWEALAPTLARGDLIFLDVNGASLERVTVAGRTGQLHDPVWQVMTDPNAFGSSLVPGSYANVLSRRDTTTVFEWGIAIPLIGSSGVMEMDIQPDRVTVNATEGSLDGGRFRYDLVTLPWGEAAVLGVAEFDPASASWLIARVIAGNALFRHGIASASNLMVVRAIRSRARRLVEGDVAVPE